MAEGEGRNASLVPPEHSQGLACTCVHDVGAFVITARRQVSTVRAPGQTSTAIRQRRADSDFPVLQIPNLHLRVRRIPTGQSPARGIECYDASVQGLNIQTIRLLA